eukprot:1806754-Rhodomonas_salina.1
MSCGFEPIDADRTLFKLKTGNGTIMIVALYVDDRLVAHNSNVDYAKFIEALSKCFKLSSNAKEVSWYLGVA